MRKGALTNVRRRTANSQDVPSYGVIENSVATHAVSITGSVACRRLRSSIRGPVPVHRDSRSSLEDIAVLPAEKPAMVVTSIYVAERLVYRRLEV
jgi:hypothetical protein